MNYTPQDFELMVRKMRQCQVNYLRTRGQEWLLGARQMQRAVDEYLAAKEKQEREPMLPGMEGRR